MKHQFSCPAVISAINILTNPFNNQIVSSLYQSPCLACVLVSEAESYMVGCMIRRYHIWKDDWSSYTGEVLYCYCDEKSAEGSFGSGTTLKQYRNVYSLKVLVKRHRLIISQDMGL